MNILGMIETAYRDACEPGSTTQPLKKKPRNPAGPYRE